MSKCTLTVTRQKRILGFAISISVLVEKKKIGSIANGKSLTKELDPGTHTVSFKAIEKEVKQEINVTDSTNSVEIIIKLRMGLLTGVAKIVEVKYN